jgi:Uncharacterized conserved protein
MKKQNIKKSFSTKEITTIAIFTALTSILAQIAIPLPFSPIPISFGLVAVYISGILLKPKHAIFTQICYLTLGAIGIPVFGNFRGGIAALFGATGGYLLVYPLIAWIVSKSLNNSKKSSIEANQNKTTLFLKASITICFAHIILYSGGTIWLSIMTGNTIIDSLYLSVFPYIPLDIVKILFCIFIVIPFRSRLISMNLLMLDD